MTVTSHPGTVLQTYRYLRLMLGMPAVFLILATLFEAVSRGEFRQSISDSYQSPVRDVFVGALMASGVCMIAYKGQSRLEDYALNFAGFNAFFVALVPNNFTQVLGDAPKSSGAADILTHDQLLANLRLALVAFLLAAALFVFLDARYMSWGNWTWHSLRRLTKVLIVSSLVAEAFFVILVGMVVIFNSPPLFGASIFGMVHFTAAALLIVNLSFAVASHAFPDQLRNNTDFPAGSDAAQKAYRVIVFLMWAGLIVGGLLIYNKVDYSVIGTEFGEIFLFIVFWLVASREEWQPNLVSLPLVRAAA